MNRGFAPIIVLIIATLVAVVVGGYLVFDLKKGEPLEEIVQLAEKVIQLTADETADWETYTNAKFSFSVKHPENWKAPKTYGGVFTPGGRTYELNNATAYEYVFTFIPGRIDDFPAIVTVYELSQADFDTSAVREEVIANMWSHWPEDTKSVTRKAITIFGNQAMFVTVTATNNRDSLHRDFVFVEKNAIVYAIEQSGSSSNNDFELFYNSFEFTQVF